MGDKQNIGRSRLFHLKKAVFQDFFTFKKKCNRMLALFQKVAFNSGNSKNSQVLKLLTQPTELIRVISTHSFSQPFPRIFPIFHDPIFLPKSPNFAVNVKIARLIHIQEMNSTLCCGRLKRQRITLIQKTQSFLWFLMTRAHQTNFFH